MQYRPEIDGLRAVAVLSVVLFHAGLSTLSGGFVGVDIFFVISGYLIASILLQEQQKRRVSIRQFYERRIRRIFPALVVVVVSTSIAAWWLLLPTHMQDYAYSVGAVSGFVSNILFWRESGYFETAAELKPLLHTWTLAVEEQYYIFFPLLLLILHRFRMLCVGLIVVAAMASLALAEWAAYAKPVAGFYLLPTRMWELLLGALAAYYWLARRPNAHNGLAALGFALIAYALLALDKTTPFPSLYTLFPTVGAVLVLLYAQPQSWVGRALALKPCVFVGLVSYSFYLWHQPLLAFTHIAQDQQSDALSIALACAAAFVLAVLSWKYVETPFRNRAFLSQRSVFALAILVIALGLGFGYAGHRSQGFAQQRFDAQERALIASAQRSETGQCSLQNCPNRDKITQDDWLLIGDSNADHFSTPLHAITTENGAALMNLSKGGCPPLINPLDYVDATADRQQCSAHNKEVMAYLHSDESPRNLFLSAGWGLHLYGSDYAYPAQYIAFEATQLYAAEADKNAAQAQLLEAFIQEITVLAEAGKQVYLAYPLPYLARELPYNIEQFLAGIAPVRQATYRAANAQILQQFDVLSEHPNIHPIKLAAYMCDGTMCPAIKDKKYLYGDRTHLSAYGAEQVIRKWWKRLSIQ